MNQDNIGQEFTFDMAGSPVKWQYKKLAVLSQSSILAHWGKTSILVTVDYGKENPEGDFFPLQVEYLEKMYASGRISSSRFIKREKFPSNNAVLRARMIDRSIRARFPSSLRTPILVTVVVLSYDVEHDPVVLAVNTVSMALMASGLPFKGPVAGIKVGFDEKEKFYFHKEDQHKKNTPENRLPMNMFVTLDENGIVMFDADYNIIPEDTIKEAMDFAAGQATDLFNAQTKYLEQLKVSQIDFATPAENKALTDLVNEKYGPVIAKNLQENNKDYWKEHLVKIVDTIIKENPEYEETPGYVQLAVDLYMKNFMKNSILKDKKRISPRNFDQIRDLDIEVDLLPQAHGSAKFSRGLTSVLSVVTLDSGEDSLIQEDMTGEFSINYMHDYVSPPYSHGEAGRVRYYPGRREVGHGALAEKAIIPVIPTLEEFPYTIRVVSEVTSSAGSTSMGSTCASSLALMAAGVPIKEHVAGIAIGLISNQDFSQYQLLTDIADGEDFYGNMDFKVTGTKKGVTAIQMDQKRLSIPISILKEAIDKAKKARLEILEAMNKVIPTPRKELSDNVPVSESIKIDENDIGKLIGPGGKTIKEISLNSDTNISVKDDGEVVISGQSKETRDKAKEMIKGLFVEPIVGEIYEGEVSQILDFGFVVKFKVGATEQSGLVHISNIADKRIDNIEDYVKIGDKVKVKLMAVEPNGRLRLSYKDANNESNHAPKQTKSDQ